MEGKGEKLDMQMSEKEKKKGKERKKYMYRKCFLLLTRRISRRIKYNTAITYKSVLHFDHFCVFCVFFYILYSVPALVAFPLTCKGITVCVRVGVRP